MPVRNLRREIHTETTEGRYSPTQLEQVMLLSTLLYGNRENIVIKF